MQGWGAADPAEVVELAWSEVVIASGVTTLSGADPSRVLVPWLWLPFEHRRL